MITATDKQSVGRLIGYLTQTGTATPVLTEIINTIGQITILRLEAGRYMINSTNGQFADVTIFNNSVDGTNPTVYSTTLPSLNAQYRADAISKYSIETSLVRTSDAVRIDISALGPIKIMINIECYNYITPIQ